MTEWQKKLKACPQVWMVLEYVREQQSYEYTGNFYDSQEAAQIDVAWRESHGRRARMECYPLLSLELAQEKWGESSAADVAAKREDP